MWEYPKKILSLPNFGFTAFQRQQPPLKVIISMLCISFSHLIAFIPYLYLIFIFIPFRWQLSSESTQWDNNGKTAQAQNTVIITVLHQFGTSGRYPADRDTCPFLEYHRISAGRNTFPFAGHLSYWWTDDEGLFYMFQQAPLGSKEANYAFRLREIPFLVAASYQQAETTEPYGVIHSCRGLLMWKFESSLFENFFQLSFAACFAAPL